MFLAWKTDQVDLVLRGVSKREMRFHGGSQVNRWLLTNSSLSQVIALATDMLCDVDFVTVCACMGFLVEAAERVSSVARWQW